MDSKATTHNTIFAQPALRDILPHTPFVCRWLFGPKFDICMFLAPAVLAPAIFVCLKPASSSAFLTFVIMQGLGVGPFHLGATWYHILNPRLRTHFFCNRLGMLLFFMLVGTILALSVACVHLMPTLLYSVYLIATVQHLTQQNIGILRLLHNPTIGDEAIASRETETRSIHASAWLFSALFLLRSSEPGSCQYILCGAAALAAIDLIMSVWRYLDELMAANKAGRVINLPAQLFWIISLAFLSPLALIPKNYSQALMIPLLVHWFQYIGLNAVLINNKYSAGHSKTQLNSQLVRFAASGVIYVTIFFFFGTQIAVTASTSYNCYKTFVALMLGLGLVHCLQEGFLWRFRDPVLRQELLAHLKARR